MSVKIVSMTADHLDEIAALERACFSRPWTKEMLKEELDNACAAFLVAEEDGKVVDGRMMNVTDFGEGGLSVTVSENGMYGNLMFTSEAIELDTIGQIVAGIEF